MIKTPGAVLALSVLALLPGEVEAQAPPPFQVMRPGDRVMSCPALIGEINDLNARLAQIQAVRRAHQNAMTETEQRNARRSGALSMLGSMRGMLPFGGGMGGVAGQVGTTVGVQAVQTTAQERADRDAANAAAIVAADAQTPPEQLRQQRLTQIAAEKHC